ncbi:beta-ketoacyl synthase N-terminal-like domain-containing protein [Pandoraea sp. NPDC087047]|uniref:beta-ketoacyl synthase N-terminal-like domain-containing protein n=1 Tax=Pandoraea sp. NPDC087047 TaxID=3364390 RepID=UPI003811E72C
MTEIKLEILKEVSNKNISLELAKKLLKYLDEVEFHREPVAIIGMAGKWPGAGSISEFWKLNMEAIPQVRPFPSSRQNRVDKDSEKLAEMQVGSYLDQIEDFDPEFFGISPREAELMDPVQRQFLSIAWLAFEDAHCPLPRLKGRSVGVYVGYCAGSDDLTYGQLIRQRNPELFNLAITGNLSPMIAGRISHLFDLRGPSLVIDTACSSSLVAVHQACQAMRQGDCEMALVGGVKLHLLPAASFESIGIESKDGMTRTFSGEASGTGIGEGVAAVVLKPLSKALRDGDEIYATILGSASNQDGSTSSLTTPNVEAQVAVIEQAWAEARNNSDLASENFYLKIGCMEAHGTGTQLGDPIEFEALSRVFKKWASDLRHHCAVGSVKSLLGHLDSAAGITGLVRAALMVNRGWILPSLHFIQPNESIDYFSSALYVNDHLIRWPIGGKRYCGVSAFSMNGTNCHVALGEQIQKTPVTWRKNSLEGVVLLSAHSPDSLRGYIRVLRKYLIERCPEFGGLLRSLAVRHHFKCRFAFSSDSIEQTIILLDKALNLWPNLSQIETNNSSEISKNYMKGISGDWSALYSEFSYARIPGTVFDTRDFWFSNTELPNDVGYDPEQITRALWKSILGSSYVSDDENFFRSGGDSLKATYFISRLSNILDCNFDLDQLWKTPTLTELLKVIRPA